MKKARNGSVKMMLLVFAAGFGIFFGVDLATKGVDTIHGPVDGSATVQAAPADGKTGGTSAAEKSTSSSASSAANSGKPAAGSASQTKVQTAASTPPEQGATLSTSFINRLSNRTGDVFRRLATLGMQLITSIFKGLLG